MNKIKKKKKKKEKEEYNEYKHECAKTTPRPLKLMAGNNKIGQKEQKQEINN
jgi:hypothetical protein